MAGTVDAVASVDIFVERLTARLTVNSRRVVTTVDTVTSVTGSLEQIGVEVAFVRLVTTVARYTQRNTNVLFLADRTDGRAYAIVLCELVSVCLSSVTYVLWLNSASCRISV